MSYTLRESVPDDVAAQLAEYSPFEQSLLYARGIADAESARDFLRPDYETQQHDPWLMPGMQVAVERTEAALTHNEHVTIFSDYDCDGIPGAVVLHDFFTKIGHERLDVYIPHRHYEGFGLSIEAVEKIHATGSTLIVTIDCGTASVDAVAKANELGIDVIVTDHHEPGEVLPDAVAIVNPKIGDTYPFPHLCGAGVVFKLVQALIDHGDYDLKPGYEKWWLDMVGMATIADMVPLTGENRVFAHFGLTVLRKSRRPGLQQLLRIGKANQAYLTEDDIGFTIGPRINAASRMGRSDDAFTLLVSQDEVEAGELARALEALNTERKTMVATMTKAANKRMKNLEEIPSVIVIGDPDWRPSLVGLTANKLAEEFNRPAFVWGRDGNGVIKGSCRSEGTTSVLAVMQAAPEAFIESGGHHFSGGFSVHEDAIHTLPSVLAAAADTFDSDSIQREIVADYQLSLDQITTDVLRSQQTLAPFGESNPKPIYVIKDVVPTQVAVFGKAKDHTKLTLDTTGIAKEAIAFFTLPDQFTKQPEADQSCTLLAQLEQSYFMGRQQTRLRIIDIV